MKEAGSSREESLQELPAIEASSDISVLFGTAASAEMDTLEQLYASQLAAILFDEMEAEKGRGRPVVVGMGLKTAFLQQQQQQPGEAATAAARERFAEVMRLVREAAQSEVIAALEA